MEKILGAMPKIAMVRTGDYLQVVLHTEEHHVIAYASLKTHPAEGLIETINTFARPQFGTLLYQSLAKIADVEDKFLISARDGDTRGPAYAQWVKFKNTLNRAFCTAIPEYLNREVRDNFYEDEDYAPLVQGYRIPASKSFKASVVDGSGTPKEHPTRVMVKQGEEFFSTSYHLDDNKWINEVMPLPDSYAPRKYPLRGKVKVEDVNVDKGTLQHVLSDIEKEQYSHSTLPITLAIDIDGDLIFDDGHHRYVEAILRGEKEIDVIIVGNEYINGFVEDLHRPNKKDMFTFLDTPFRGLEALNHGVSIDVLAERCQEREQSKVQSGIASYATTNHCAYRR